MKAFLWCWNGSRFVKTQTNQIISDRFCFIVVQNAYATANTTKMVQMETERTLSIIYHVRASTLCCVHSISDEGVDSIRPQRNEFHQTRSLSAEVQGPWIRFRSLDTPSLPVRRQGGRLGHHIRRPLLRAGFNEEKTQIQVSRLFISLCRLFAAPARRFATVIFRSLSFIRISYCK